MLKARKRITRKQIKQDKFVTTYFKTVDFIKENSSKLTMAFAGVVVIIFLVLLFIRSKRTAEINASEELAKANTELSRGQLQQAVDILLNMSENYSGTKSAARGTYLLAYTYFQKGEYENALQSFKKYLDDYGKDPVLTSASYSGMGACYEEQGKFLDAAQSYEKGSKEFSDNFNAPQQLMDAGRCYTIENRIADARNCYEKVIEKYPDSGFKNDAELYLAKLKG